MAGGLFALLDDVAALARMAAASVDDVGAAAGKASANAVGVVVDDTAVTPRYVHGLAAERELPIIKKIAAGSLRNKLLIILPVILVLSQFLPVAVTIILVLGGLYLSFEGAEKVHHALTHRGSGTHGTDVDSGEAQSPSDDAITSQPAPEPAQAQAPSAAASEKQIVAEAVRTDLILSTEIMVIALKTVDHQPFLTRAISLVVVAFLITALVYGVVALIVKMDDVGLHLVESGRNPRLGRRLVDLMPKVMSFLSTVGVAAMLWVGGHILLTNAAELGWHGPYAIVHHAEEAVHDATGPIGAVLGWCMNTVASAVVGLVIGMVIVGVVLVVGRGRGTGAAPGAGH